MAQQRESGSSGSQLLQHGRANALRLTLRPKPNAKQASNTLVRDFLFIAFSFADGTTGALLPLPSGAPTADAVQRGSPRLLPQPVRFRDAGLVQAASARSRYFAMPLVHRSSRLAAPWLRARRAAEGLGEGAVVGACACMAMCRHARRAHWRCGNIRSQAHRPIARPAFASKTKATRGDAAAARTWGRTREARH